MKCYVREFANDEMKYCPEERKPTIEKIVRHHERGFITAFEAVRLIVELHYK